MRRPLILAVMTLVVSGVPTAGAAIRTVGPGADCDFADLQVAIQNTPFTTPNEIRVMAGVYAAQAIKITDRELVIRGGYADCTGPDHFGRSYLSGVGGAADSVITVTGVDNDVTLAGLAVVQGDEVDDGYGGGIDFRGAGELAIEDTWVNDNVAGYGGGISVTGTGGPALLRLGIGSLVRGNTAWISGGGIRLDGNARLDARRYRIEIRDNEAVGDEAGDTGGFGGGVLVIGPARAELGSHGQAGALAERGMISGNRARYGGGVAVVSTEQGAALLLVYSGLGNLPTRFVDNSASRTGGAIYLRPFVDLSDTHYAEACLSGIDIDGNSAQNGSAIYGESDPGGPSTSFSSAGSRINVGTDPAGANWCPGTLDTCIDQSACSLIRNNVTRTRSGQATDGATLLLQGEGHGLLNIRRASLSDNRGGRVLQSFGATRINGSVFEGNVTTRELIRQEADDDGLLWIDTSTVAGNSVAATHVISTNDDLHIADAILWQPGKLLLQRSGGAAEFSDLLVSERASIDGGSNGSIIVADPRFVDPARADYRLRAHSPAIDITFTGAGGDRDGQPYGTDIPEIPNFRGPYDLGAYERAAFQPLVLNGHFDADLHFWTERVPGATTYDAAEGYFGDPIVGSLKVSAGDIDAPRVGASSQCVYLPVPGRYRLNAAGKSAGVIGQRDSTVLHWTLRHNASPGCGDGRPVDATGEHGLSAAPSWLQPSAAAIIDVPPGVWTPQSSLVIRLDVIDAGVSVQPSVLGWFDYVTLELEGEVPGSATIFRDGFDLP